MPHFATILDAHQVKVGRNTIWSRVAMWPARVTYKEHILYVVGARATTKQNGVRVKVIELPTFTPKVFVW